MTELMTETLNIQSFLETVEATRAERDSLLAKALRLEQALDFEKRLTNQLTEDRDYYMQFATKLATNLGSIQAIINDAVRDARDLMPEKPKYVVESPIIPGHVIGFKEVKSVK